MKLFKVLAAVAVVVSGVAGQTWEIGSPNAYDVTATLSDGVLTISGEGAMQNNNPPWYSVRYNITSVVINNGVTTIGDYAFAECPSLESIVIGNSVTEIGNNAFSWCTSLKSIVIPDGVTKIGNNAFYGTPLESIVIPNSVTEIGNYAFYYCRSLESVVIGNTVTKIGNSAFQRCSSLVSIVIPNSVTEIGTLAFSDCDELTRADFLRRGQTVISTNSFSNTPSTLEIYGYYPQSTNLAAAAGARFIPYQFDMSLDVSQYAFLDAQYGYKAQNPLEVKLTTTTNYPLSEPSFSIALSGINASSFKLNTTTIDSFNENGEVTFTVTPIEGLDAGRTYEAAVIVSDPTGDFPQQRLDVSFTVNKRTVGVIWGEKRSFVYNKMLQHPSWELDFDGIPKEHLAILNAQSVTGEYTIESGLAPFIIILPEHDNDNYLLTNTRVGYEITQRPLNVVMVDAKGEAVDEIVLERRKPTTRNTDDINCEELRAQITANITYRGWAIDTLTKEEDNEDNSLRGNLIIEIVGVEDYKESVKDGEYEVNVNTGLINARDYALDNLTLTAVVGDKITLLTESGIRPDPNDPKENTSIRETNKRRQNILAKTVVRDEMRVVLEGVTRGVVYDNLGNVVWDGVENVWDLRNAAGRRVAEGTYLVAVEVGGRWYSARVGVKR